VVAFFAEQTMSVVHSEKFHCGDENYMRGRRLTILFTNIWLDSYAGSEVVIRDLAIGSMCRGHRPIVYTPKVGDVAQELKRNGVAVIDDLRMLAESPDIIHAHHSIPGGEAIIRFPSVPALNVCHAFESWIEAPIQFPQVGAYVAVDVACRDRLVHEEGIDPKRVLVLPNAVDLKRVPLRLRPLPKRPQRAVAFGKASDVAQIFTACESLSIDIEAIGYPLGRGMPDPEKELVNFDLVFASGRAALEALCCGCAVIACDARGIAGPITSENFSSLREKNFGLRSLTGPVSTERLIRDIRQYDREDAEAVCGRARHEADLEKLLDEFDKLYADILYGERRPSMPSGAHEAAVATFLHNYLPRRPNDIRWPWLQERESLRAQVIQASADLDGVRAQVSAELDGVRAQASADLDTVKAQLDSTLHELAAIKRSRLIKFGRWLRRIRGLPVVY
jgi:hypothetical protein